VVNVVNAANKAHATRALLDKVLGVDPEARIPEYHSDTLRRRLRSRRDSDAKGEPAGRTKGRVVLFATCYGNYNEPDVGSDLVAVFEHNGIPVTIANRERCCGMPKLELGDLEAVEVAKNANIPELLRLVDEGWDIVAPVPSCVLMFKQELPLIFPDDPDVQKVRAAIFDPFEYLMIRHKEGKLRTDFKNPLGKVAYQVSCHLRVQNLGLKTKEALDLVPGTEVIPIERCSGHDGTYAVKREFFESAMKIGRPVVNKIKQLEADHYGSDCPMAGHHLENGLRDGRAPEHPMTLLRKAYGI
jgi:Fe-S oxidoreductase